MASLNNVWHRFLLTACVAVSVLCGSGHHILHSSDSGLGIAIQDDGTYTLSIAGQAWLKSAPTFFQVNGKRYSNEDGSLKLSGIDDISGEDRVGPWQGIRMRYQANQTPIGASIRVYQNVAAIVFAQEYSLGASGSNITDRNATQSMFPNFHIDSSLAELAYLAYGYMHMGDMGKMSGRWERSAFSIWGGLDGGPLYLFNKKSDALFISSFSEFMVGSPYHNKSGGHYGWGIMGSVQSIPKEFTYETVIFYSAQGIRQVVADWGVAMRRMYNKDTSYRNSDMTINYLSYWTDNGAYYVNYYVQPSYIIQNMTYQQALIGYKKYADQMNIPYRSFQYSVWYLTDSYWGGTVAWKPNPKMISGTMEELRDTLGLQSTAHNRWWTATTPYAKQNGGPYNFLMDNKYSLPIDHRFWMDIFQESKNWGMKDFMQDWLNAVVRDTDIALKDVYTLKTWLKQMGDAALANDITVQYCMSLGRHVLQSLEINAVTQMRASNDYQPSPDYSYEQWRIGITSMLAHAVGVAPFKDVFWSTSDQPGNYYKGREPYPALQAFVSTVSTGPVGPGDMIGRTDRDLLMKCCREDGLILKPSRPPFPVDDQIKASGFHDESGPDGEVWTTYSDIGLHRFGLIFAAGLSRNYQIGPTIAQFGPQPSYIYTANVTSAKLPEFMDTMPLTLTAACSRGSFCLYYTTPVFKQWARKNNVILLGELSKWIPMSPQRVSGISDDDLDLRVYLKGAVAEKVKFHFIQHGSLQSVTCTMSEDGSAWISFTSATCFS